MYKRAWVAPEMLMLQPYDTKVDIWGLGMLLYEMVEHEVPFLEYPPLRAIYMVISEGIPPLTNSNTYGPAFHDFYHQCTQKDPQLRPSADTLLEHPFLHLACTPQEFLLHSQKQENELSASDLDTILFSQNADGSWSNHVKLAQIIPNLSSSHSDYLTARVIEYLISNFSEKKEEWNLILSKALYYFDQRGKSHLLQPEIITLVRQIQQSATAEISRQQNLF